MTATEIFEYEYALFSGNLINFDKGHTKYGLNADANLISAILGSMQNIREKDIEAAYVLIDNATSRRLTR